MWVSCCDVQWWEGNRGCGSRDHAYRPVDRIMRRDHRADPDLLTCPLPKFWGLLEAFIRYGVGFDDWQVD